MKNTSNFKPKEKEQIECRWTDKEIKDVYSTLIGKSWEGAEFFESHQAAWNIIKKKLGVKEITNNGYGEVIRK